MHIAPHQPIPLTCTLHAPLEKPSEQALNTKYPHMEVVRKVMPALDECCRVHNFEFRIEDSYRFFNPCNSPSSGTSCPSDCIHSIKPMALSTGMDTLLQCHTQSNMRTFQHCHTSTPRSRSTPCPPSHTS